MICALLLPTDATAAELFTSPNDSTSGKLNWSFCVGVRGDGAAALAGRLSGFTTRVKGVTSECESTHCVTRREVLAGRKVPPELKDVLQDVIKTISRLKAQALDSHLSRLREEVDAEHAPPPAHTELGKSRGRHSVCEPGESSGGPRKRRFQLQPDTLQQRLLGPGP